MKTYYIIAAVVVAGFIALGASSMKSAMTPYKTDFAEVRATAEKVQVPGDVVKSKSSTFDQKEGAFIFFIRDPKGSEMKVVYRGVKPGNFEQANKVVAIGQYRDGALQAEQLLVKCPSKYQGENGGSGASGGNGG